MGVQNLTLFSDGAEEMAKTWQVQAPRGVRRMVLQIEVAQALDAAGRIPLWCDVV